MLGEVARFFVHGTIMFPFHNTLFAHLRLPSISYFVNHNDFHAPGRVPGMRVGEMLFFILNISVANFCKCL